jgi:hypothetical protein
LLRCRPQQLSSSEFQLAFKKLNKRDSVTKLKGLQELKTLFEDIAGKGEDVDAVIQAWVYSFLRLAADDDPKVRVALCNTFAGLVQAVKKKLAAQLKRIMVRSSERPFRCCCCCCCLQPMVTMNLTSNWLEL